MQIEQHISLKPYNTFGIEHFAKYFISVTTLDELQNVMRSNKSSDIFILGGGSNLLLTKDIDALVIHINLKGISIVSETDSEVDVKCAAGENWHEFVLYCLANDYGGIENLSLIPGNVGTAPIQNIGAYGVELKDVFVSCEALNLSTNTIETFSNADCNFDYRNSIFKQSHKGKYIILNVTFRLTKKNHNIKTTYGAISQELKQMNVLNPTIQDVSKAVIAIRESKLPDPKKIGNSGSFFKNPLISLAEYKKLQANFPSIPCYTVTKNTVKVPAGWLIEKVGFKGKRYGNYGVHQNQALVLVNYNDANGEDIFELSKLIQSTIKRIFNINLETEVNII